VGVDSRRAVRAAEWVLWAWAAWVTGLGIYQSGNSIRTAKDMMERLQITLPFSAEALQGTAIAGYVVSAVFLAWMVLKIGEGRRWARTGLLLSFACDAASTGLPPYHGVNGILLAAADLGPQAMAAFLIYTSPGRLMFEPKAL
jgi:hypothetical protein